MRRDTQIVVNAVTTVLVLASVVWASASLIFVFFRWGQR